MESLFCVGAPLAIETEERTVRVWPGTKFLCSFPLFLIFSLSLLPKICDAAQADQQLPTSSPAASSRAAPSRPTSAFLSDAAAAVKSKASSSLASASASASAAAQSLLRTKGASTWWAEVALAAVALLTSLLILCVNAAKGLSQLASLDAAVAAAERTPSAFAPVRSLSLAAVVLCPILAALSLLSLGSLLSRGTGAASEDEAGGGGDAGAVSPSPPPPPPPLRSRSRWARAPSSRLSLPALVAALLVSSLFSSLVLASSAGGASYSSALTKASKQATAVYQAAKDVLERRVGGAVRSVDTLGGALPENNGILKTAFGALQAARGSRIGGALLAPLTDEIDAFGKTVGLADPSSAAQLRAAGTQACAPECLDLSFVPFLSGSRCICSAALLVTVAEKSASAAGSFKTATVGAGMLAATHAAMLARGGWAGGVASASS